ncbi:hypothetical protein GOB94_10935 [Granulicella sp. 5B5]|uniref:hypothetical protein n=1 Tax=Granulicella sp. 5B5 TaxID=1617967 RepID=UPI0017768505|nr:hypothetical protein [Granulicella sp. 5B5]QMV19131.1 hypothetical protein GOB94_10935 [Granulicella sp. 5B5]
MSALPVGLSVVGCGHHAATVVYCNGGDSGPATGQIASISLSPTLATTGESLNYTQIGSALSATAIDCKGASVSVSKWIYATSNMAVADINPSTGQVCAGIWNRNTGGGIQDYTVCQPYATPPTQAPTITLSVPAATGSPVNYTYTAANPGALQFIGGTVTSITLTDSGVTTTQTITSGILAVQKNDVVTVTYTAAPTINFIPNGSLAYVTATAEGGGGATSNGIAIYVHPVVTGIVLGGATASCTTDPGTDCCPNNTVGTSPSATTGVYTAGKCLSQGQTGQLVARIYANGGTSPADNVTCSVGHISYSPLSSGIVTIDENGIATANLPGSTLITANVSNSSTATQSGFFSTCPPASITLQTPTGATSATVGPNNLLPLTTVVKDTNGVTLNGLSLEFQSTTPQTIPAAVGSVTPTYPGTAVLTAVCLPGSCNPAPFSQIGLFGNGQPITSNGVTITAPGTASEVIYMGSTQSQYVTPRDFTLGQISSAIKLQYVPNSMVITQDGSTIYLGSSQGLQTISTATNTIGAVNENVPGTVLAVSPDGSTVVVTDPVRQTVSLYSASSSAVISSYGGVANSARWSPDSQTVYITLQGKNQILTYSAFTNWEETTLDGKDQAYTDAAVMVPSVGAFFAGQYTEARSYCPVGTLTGTGTPQTVVNNFAPLASESSAPTPTDKLAATNDGLHIIGATASGTPTLTDVNLSGTVNPTAPKTNPEQAACPPAGTALPTNYFPTTFTTTPLTGITATAITKVIPEANSSLAFVTYSGSSGILPEYIPSASGAGTLVPITLGNGATAASAPISGVFSTDGTTFYAGTSGDNQVHVFTISGTTATETSVLTPALPLATGTGTAPIDLIAQKPKKTLN